MYIIPKFYFNTQTNFCGHLVSTLNMFDDTTRFNLFWTAAVHNIGVFVFFVIFCLCYKILLNECPYYSLKLSIALH